jgi:hypothetical protein
LTALRVFTPTTHESMPDKDGPQCLLASFTNRIVGGFKAAL